MKKRKNFQIIGKRTFKDGLGFAKIITQDGEPAKIHITLPRTVGNAVQRNRFRRIARTALPFLDPKLLENDSLWLSLDRRRRLSKKITRKDLLPQFREILRAL
jgi:ribonuclease P protein component